MTREREKIYILLTDTGTLFTKAIKKYTKAPYNHSSLSFDKDLREMYSFGRKKPRNPINGGFVKEDTEKGTYQMFPKTSCALLEIEVTQRQIEKLRRMIDLFEKKKGRVYYNLPGVIGVALKETIEPRGAYFCSQFVADLLKRAGICSWDKNVALITPEDFRNCPQTKVIYEGLLRKYPPVRKRLKENDKR